MDLLTLEMVLLLIQCFEVAFSILKHHETESSGFACLEVLDNVSFLYPAKLLEVLEQHFIW